MPELRPNFELERCPHCSVHRPFMNRLSTAQTKDHADRNKFWGFYMCNNCGGIVTAAGKKDGSMANEIYPEPRSVDDAIPERARQYLKQAIDSIHAPAKDGRYVPLAATRLL